MALDRVVNGEYLGTAHTVAELIALLQQFEKPDTVYLQDQITDQTSMYVCKMTKTLTDGSQVVDCELHHEEP